MGKRKASKKKIKKGEAQDSNNQNHHSNNNSSTQSQGSVDDSKSWEERDSDGGEREREEEEIVDQQEDDAEKDEGLKEEVFQVAIEEKSLENGSGSADYSAVNVADENPIVVSTREEDSVAGKFGVEDKEVAVVEEDKKSVIFQFGEQKAESSVMDDKAIVDFVEEEAPMKFNKSVGAQIIDDEEEDQAKKGVEVAPKEFTSAGAESLVMLVQADAHGSELAKNVDSSFSQISDYKEEILSAIETEKSEQIENQVEALPIDDQAESLVAPVVSNGAQIETPVEAPPVDDQAMSLVAPVTNGSQIKNPDEAPSVYDQAKSAVAPVVSNGAVGGAELLETDNSGDAVVVNTSREVDNGKKLEIQKRSSEDQTPIGTNPLLARRTSWMGCCGLFEVFSGAKR